MNEEKQNQTEQAIKKPIYKKWWFWVIAVIFVVLFYSSLNNTADEWDAKQDELDSRLETANYLSSVTILSLREMDAMDEMMDAFERMEYSLALKYAGDAKSEYESIQDDLEDMKVPGGLEDYSYLASQWIEHRIDGISLMKDGLSNEPVDMHKIEEGMFIWGRGKMFWDQFQDKI